jgi:2,3-bisphosphoglycerate-dependent phosphoglycerate mutase
MHLEDISEEEIPKLEIPTGKPLIYELDKDLKVIDRKYL